MGIQCIEVKLYKLQNDLYLDMEHVTPLPLAADYQFKMREKSDAIQRSAAQKRNETSIDTLVNAGILRAGSPIRMIRPPRPDLVLDDTDAFRAEYVSDKRFKWKHESAPEGATYSVTGLTVEVDKLLKGNSTSSFNGAIY